MELNIVNKPAVTAQAIVNVDTFGNPFGLIPTYQVQVFDVIPAAAATDVLVLTGSATKVVKITRVKITAAASAAAGIDFYSYKRTTPNSGGTFTNPTPVKYDSLNSNPTAVPVLYSANPTTLGTGVMVAGTKYMIPGTQGNTWFPVVPVVVDYGTRNNEPIILRGVNESYSVSLRGQTVAAGTELYISIEWTEE